MYLKMKQRGVWKFTNQKENFGTRIEGNMEQLAHRPSLYERKRDQAQTGRVG